MSFCRECGLQHKDNAKFCAQCGEPRNITDLNVGGLLKEKTEVTLTVSEVVNSPSPNQCPICGQIDAVQRVSTLIDGGTTNTAGQAISMPVFNQHPISNTFLTGFSSQSRSHLVLRFNTPRIPRANFFSHFFAWWGVCALLIGIWSNNINSGLDNPAGVAFGVALGLGGVIGIFPGAIIALISTSISTNNMGAERNAWMQKVQRLRSAYYCARDDVAFLENIQAAPDHFVRIIFSR